MATESTSITDPTTTASASLPTPSEPAARQQPSIAFTPPTEIFLRIPTTSTASSPSLSSPSFASSSPSSELQPPPLSWLERTWTVSHSTLPMWRKAKNVRITYKTLPPVKEGGPARLDDCVESVPTQKTLLPQPKEVRGVDTAVVGEEGEGWRWNWRGKGLLMIASSKWQVLGYGSRTVAGITESWAVTYFESTLFTPAGVDIYTDRREGMSEGLYGELERALVALGEEGGGVGKLCKEEMRRVVVDDA